MTGDPATKTAARAPTPTVVCRGLTKAYEGRKGLSLRQAVPFRGGRLRQPVFALRDVNLEMSAGESIGIIGPNGAGKSTLLKLVAGVTRATAGSAAVRGTLRSIIELGVGFHPELTGWENLACSSVLLGRPVGDVEESCRRAAEFAELGDALERPLKHYSSGMEARLAFALATETRPDVIVVDEVLAVGDQRFQSKCLDRIAEFSDEGTTVMFVSHEMPVVASVCTRAVQIREGRVVDDGPCGEVIERYLSRSAGDLRSAADDPVTVHDIAVPPHRVDNRFHVDVEFTTNCAIADPFVGVDMILPMFDPDTALASSIDPLPPLPRPGRYRAFGQGPVGDHQMIRPRFRVSLVDGPQQRVMGTGSRDFATFGNPDPTQLGHLGASPVMEVTWQRDLRPPHDAAAETAGPEVTALHGSGSDAPAVAIVRADKVYGRSGPFERIRRAVPGPLGKVRHPTVHALDHVSARIVPGEAVGIIGPNGAGKSTLLAAVGRIVGLDAGTIATNGKVVPQLELGPGFHPELSGSENVAILLRLLGVPASDVADLTAKVEDFADIGDAVQRAVKHYSTGMVARLALAILVNVPADVMLIDEVLAVGDQAFRRKVLEAVSARQRAGVTVAFVSHEIQLIEQICGRVLRLDDGSLIDDGPADRVLREYSGRGWAGGVSDASTGLRMMRLQLDRSGVLAHSDVHFSGDIAVDTPYAAARIELAIRALPEDRGAFLTADDRRRMTIFSTIVEPPGFLAEPGIVHYTGTIAPTVEGEMDLVISIIDELDGTPLAEAWRTITVGDLGEGRHPHWAFDFEWTLEGPLDPPVEQDG